MVKIYIQNFCPNFSSLKDKLTNKSISKIIYSSEGIFEITDKHIYSCEPEFESKINAINIHGKVFYFDYTKTIKDIVVSQLPTEYNEYTLSKSIYKTNALNNLEFVVEELNGVIDTCYFYYKEDKEILKNNYFLEEFNEFLNDLF
jgi:predicted membrane-bound dolichyl-phosphate-mannose-protein mannosyltransferase